RIVSLAPLTPSPMAGWGKTPAAAAAPAAAPVVPRKLRRVTPFLLVIEADSPGTTRPQEIGVWTARPDRGARDWHHHPENPRPQRAVSPGRGAGGGRAAGPVRRPALRGGPADPPPRKAGRSGRRIEDGT